MMTERASNSNQVSVPAPQRRGKSRRQRGQAAIEFLLVLPIFIALFLLVVDLGLLMYHYVSVSNAVREGTRFGSVNCGDGSCTEDEIKGRVVRRSGGILSDPADLPDIQVDWIDNNGDGTNNTRGDSVVVRVNHPYNFLFFPATIPVVSCADMSLEQSDLTAGLPSGIEC